MATKEQKGIVITPTIADSRYRLYRPIRSLPEGVFIADLSPQRKRAASGQGGNYWGHLISEIGQFLGLDRESVDNTLCGLFLAQKWHIKGTTVRVVKTTSPSETDNFYTKVRAYAWNVWRLNPDLPGGIP